MIREKEIVYLVSLYWPKYNKCSGLREMIWAYYTPLISPSTLSPPPCSVCNKLELFFFFFFGLFQVDKVPDLDKVVAGGGRGLR